MSYLQRLVTNPSMNNEDQQLQPFIRSTSPIADRDQRIGMPDFAGGFMEISEERRENKEEISEQLVNNQDNSLSSDFSPPTSSPVSPKITSVNLTSDATAQRKMASQTPNLTSSNSPSTPEVSPLSPVAETPLTVNPIPNQNDDLGLSVSDPDILSDLPNIEQKSAEISPYIALDSLKDPLPPNFSVPSFDISQLTPSPSVPTNPEIVEKPSPIEKSISSQSSQKRESEALVSPLTESFDPSSDPEPLISTEPVKFAELNQIKLRSLGEIPSINQPRLEPLTPSNREIEPSQPLTSPSTEAETTNDPKVVIGRTNVEIVPPLTVKPSQTKASQPLTAASVSVIGPLGNPVRPSVRFSLRQR